MVDHSGFPTKGVYQSASYLHQYLAVDEVWDLFPRGINMGFLPIKAVHQIVSKVKTNCHSAPSLHSSTVLLCHNAKYTMDIDCHWGCGRCHYISIMNSEGEV